MLADKQIESSKKKIEKIKASFEERSEVYDLCSDPTRLRLLYLFKMHAELCPTDISNVLGLSMSAVSHQVRVLELAGYLDKVKMGKMVCYSLSRNGKKFFKNWVKL